MATPIEDAGETKAAENTDLDQETAKIDEIPDSKEGTSPTREESNSESARMVLLRKAIDKTVDKCVSAGRFSLFAKNHPSLAKKSVNSLQHIHKQYQEKLLEAIHGEVETMFKEENMGELMKELDRLTAEVPPDQQSREAWRPSGDPDQDLAAHLIPVKLKQRERLQKILAHLEEDNDRLMKIGGPKRQNLQDMCKQMNAKVGKLKQATQDLDMEKIDNFISS